MKEEQIRSAVREYYGQIAQEGGHCCSPGAPACSGGDPAEVSTLIGYAPQELQQAPQEADLGLGCGNPLALASLQPGETVLDLGSGGGLDCFLAARQVGPDGKVIGVDMTPAMLERARQTAEKNGYLNVEFRLGEIENLPVADGSADAVISNCVINLSTRKGRVFEEAFRVLKPGGRLMISDIVLNGELPGELSQSLASYVGCLAGALRKPEYLDLIGRAGFEQIEIAGEAIYPTELIAPGTSAAAGLIASLTVHARKAADGQGR